MSTGKTNLTSTQFAAKKLLGKAHTSNLRGDVNESIPSNVSIVSDGVFAEPIPNTPTDQMYVRSGEGEGSPLTVEKVILDVVGISGTEYDANDSGGGGDEASGYGKHGYYLKLESNYQTTSSNPDRGTGNFTNGKRIYDSRGGLQLVPPFASNASPNKYFLKLYKGAVDVPSNEITAGDPIDWQVDYYSGVVFIQDYNSSFVPTKAVAYLYVGKYLNDKISSGTNLTVKEEGSNLTTVANSINFVGAHVTASTSGNDVTVTVNAGAGGIANIVSDTTPQLGGDLDVNGNDIISVSNADISLLPNGSGKVVMDGNGSTAGVSIADGTIEMRTGNSTPAEIKMYCEVNNAHYVRLAAPPHAAFSGNPDFVLPPTEGTNGQFLKTDGAGTTSWADAVSYGRTSINANYDATVNDRIIGANATGSMVIKLPAASAFSSGQHFIIKDEAGNADSNNITVFAAGTDTIDGQSSVILQSAYSAINLYSNGSNKFFIY